MLEEGCSILVADDDPGNLLLLKKVLSKAAYNVVTVPNGMQVFEAVKKQVPDLFLLDILMPELDGLEVCRRLKRDEALRRIPVIFITSQDKTRDVLVGFEAGAADYIAKPVNNAELLARVRTHVRLYRSILELERLKQLALEANPLTGLPGNNSLAEAITRALSGGAAVCVIYCDLDNFKAFNDKYGFARGDAAIRFTAETILGAMRRLCGEDGFIGHIGGDDFSILVPSGRAEAVASEIARRFDEGVACLYDPEDARAGFIASENRQHEQEKFPIMSLSMGGVDLSGRAFRHYLEVANVCADVKRVAKGMAGSGVFFDRRK